MEIILGATKDWLIVMMGSETSERIIITLFQNLSSHESFIFLIFGLFSVAFSCASSLNNSLSVRISAFFSWMSLFVIALLFMHGSGVIVWVALCMVMTILHLLQIFSWTFGRVNRRKVGKGYR
jgi:hypothetical protein